MGKWEEEEWGNGKRKEINERKERMGVGRKEGRKK